MATTVDVRLGDRSYPIWIGRGLLGSLGSLCRERGLTGHALLVTDSGIAPLYGEAAADSLAAAGIASAAAVVPAGEASKTHDRLLELYRAAVEAGLDRSSFVVALGGGVVGDLAGFMAATYLRGVRYVQVPTSLLAMVDSSVGGKTGVDLPWGKNLVGAFHQPSLVVVDLDTLPTLPAAEFRSGMAEVVKYGLIRDASLFGTIERLGPAALDPAGATFEEVVAACCRHKAEVVAADEREGGLRATLNFGHTLGHALEAATGFARWRHGEAVAIGMAYAARLSVRLTGLPPADHDRILSVLRGLGLPTTSAVADLCWSEVAAAMARDKKAAGRVPRFVLLERIGSARYGIEVPAEVLKEAWDALRQ